MAVTNRPARVGWNPRRIVTLAAGDAIAFNIVTAIGLLNHGELTGLGRVGEVIQIATPFVVSWLAVAPVMGAFRNDVVDQPRRVLPRVALSWLVAVPIGLFLWSLVRQKTVQPSFAIVMFITNLIGLLGWRGAFAWLSARGRGR